MTVNIKVSTELCLVSVSLANSTTGFFDVPVDNLYAKGLLQRYIMLNIPNYKEAIIVSPDAGGAKRASAIADALGSCPFSNCLLSLWAID